MHRGNPDAFDSIVLMAYGKGESGRLVVLKNGRYDNVPIEVVTNTSKLVEVDQYCNINNYSPCYKGFDKKSFFIMGSGL